MKIFNQYSGLRREIYVLFFGRIVTCLGSMIHPLLTLILSNKLHFDAASIASLMLIMSIVQIPLLYVAGHLADHHNKRNIIIICDIITVVCYIIAGMIDLSLITIGLIFIASLFATIEYPVYDALIADMSSNEDRERAYSLNYLGSNLGIVLAPSIGGMLFANHLNLVFFIDAISTALSTFLIYLFVKDVTIEQNSISIYEENEEHLSIFSVLKKRKVIIYFIFCTVVIQVLYSQFNFLMPLNFEKLYGESGAIIFGTLTSLNGLVVIIMTPLLTSFSKKIKDVDKIYIGTIFMVFGYMMYIFIQGMIPWYYVSMIIFTIGEIYNTLGSQPYLTRRIPASHRGRVASVQKIFMNISVAILQNGIGFLIDHHTMVFMWKFITLIGFAAIIIINLLKIFDKKVYPLLYK